MAADRGKKQTRAKKPKPPEFEIEQIPIQDVPDGEVEPCDNRLTFARWVFGIGRTAVGSQQAFANNCERIARQREEGHACENKDCEGDDACEYDYAYFAIRADQVRLRTRRGRRKLNVFLTRGILATGCFCESEGKEF